MGPSLICNSTPYHNPHNVLKLHRQMCAKRSVGNVLYNRKLNIATFYASSTDANVGLNRIRIRHSTPPYVTPGSSAVATYTTSNVVVGVMTQDVIDRNSNRTRTQNEVYCLTIGQQLTLYRRIGLLLSLNTVHMGTSSNTRRRRCR